MEASSSRSPGIPNSDCPLGRIAWCRSTWRLWLFNRRAKQFASKVVPMLETFWMQKGNKEYKRLVGAFERIFGATIFFGTDNMAGKAKLVQRSRSNFLQEAQICYNRDFDQRPLSDDFENVVVLSDEFYREITNHPIPTDLEAVKILAGAPAALDLFMWLSYRCFVAAGQESIPCLESAA